MQHIYIYISRKSGGYPNFLGCAVVLIALGLTMGRVPCQPWIARKADPWLPLSFRPCLVLLLGSEGTGSEVMLWVEASGAETQKCALRIKKRMNNST